MGPEGLPNSSKISRLTLCGTNILKTLQQNLEVIDGRAFKEFDLDEYKTAAGEMLFTGRRVLEYAKEIRRIAEEHLLEIKDIFPH